jgi:hypothetical protein
LYRLIHNNFCFVAAVLECSSWEQLQFTG